MKYKHSILLNLGHKIIQIILEHTNLMIQQTTSCNPSNYILEIEQEASVLIYLVRYECLFIHMGNKKLLSEENLIHW